MDINPGMSPNANGSPATPGTKFQGPLMAGGVLQSDGSGNLASLGGGVGSANVGYASMAQSMPVTQAAGGSGDIVIPAQSQILRMYLMVTTAWNGTAATLGVGDSVSATTFTAANAVNGGSVGLVAINPAAGQLAAWKNTGTTDKRITITSANTGAGVGMLTVEYIQGINNA